MTVPLGVITRMEINELLRLWKDGTVSGCGIEELRARSQRCVVFIQNGYSDAMLAKAAYDAEILRKETQRRRDELIPPKNSLPNNNSDRWYKKIVVGIVISVSAGLLLLLIKFLLGI
jgi:hypothetical protein